MTDHQPGCTGHCGNARCLEAWQMQQQRMSDHPAGEPRTTTWTLTGPVQIVPDPQSGAVHITFAAPSEPPRPDHRHEEPCAFDPECPDRSAAPEGQPLNVDWIEHELHERALRHNGREYYFDLRAVNAVLDAARLAESSEHPVTDHPAGEEPRPDLSDPHEAIDEASAFGRGFRTGVRSAARSTAPSGQPLDVERHDAQTIGLIAACHEKNIYSRLDLLVALSSEWNRLAESSEHPE